MYEHDESTWVSSPIDVAEGGLLAIYRGVDSPRVLVDTEPAIVQAAAEQHGLNDGVVDVPVVLLKLGDRCDLGRWLAVLVRLIYRSLTTLLSWLALSARSSAS